MTQDEGDSLGGRLGPLRPGRQLGRRVGGEARRPALSRLDSRPRQARVGAQGGAGRPEGAADEGCPAHRHHPRCPAAGICQGARAAAGQCARHGLDLRAPAHGDGAGAGLAGEVRQVRQGGLVRGVAGPGPSRDAARRHRGRGQAAVSRHGVGARSRPQPAEAGVRRRPALRSGHPHRRDPRRDHHAPARGARLSPRGQARRALPPPAARRAQRACARGRGLAFDRPAAHHDLAAGRASAQLEEPRRRRRRTSSPSTCSAPGTCRSMSTA